MYNRALYTYVNICTYVCTHTGSCCTHYIHGLATGLLAIASFCYHSLFLLRILIWCARNLRVFHATTALFLFVPYFAPYANTYLVFSEIYSSYWGYNLLCQHLTRTYVHKHNNVNHLGVTIRTRLINQHSFGKKHFLHYACVFVLRLCCHMCINGSCVGRKFCLLLLSENQLPVHMFCSTTKQKVRSPTNWHIEWQVGLAEKNK